MALKAKLIKEAESNSDKILLHDEIAEADGTFTDTAMWEDAVAKE